MSKRRKRNQANVHTPPAGEAPEPPPRRQPPRISHDERVLCERIERFVFLERFQVDLEAAYTTFFERVSPPEGISEVEHDHHLAVLHQWFIFDYVTAAGATIIDLFAAEMGPRLPATQQRMLDEWRATNHSRLFEVQAVEPGVRMTVQDLLDGEVFEVADVTDSCDARRWQVALARTASTQGKVHLAGMGAAFPPRLKAEVLDFARALWKKYQRKHPRAPLAEFYRRHGFDLYCRVWEVATRPPALFAPEGHPVVFCEAHYTVTDPDAARARLDEAEEFACAGLTDEGALSYAWLKRGRSHVPEVPTAAGGLLLDGQMMPTEEGHGDPVVVLGNVHLWRGPLRLDCVSRARLEAGKALLGEVLGDLVHHVGDRSHDADSLLEAGSRFAPLPQQEEAPTPEQEAALRRMIREQQESWPDTPLPALDGKTPRQAARDPALREQLEEMLKHIEYTEEQMRRDGEPRTDVAGMRRDLGLPTR